MGFHPVVELSSEVADFLAQQFADEVFHELQDSQEFSSIEDLGRMKDALDREWEKIVRLREDRKAELTGPLLAFTGRELGRWEFFELDGWDPDDPEYSEKRRMSRAAFVELSEAARTQIAKKLAEDEWQGEGEA